MIIILKRYPWEMLHDYPKDIQAAATLPEPTEKQKKQAKLFGTFGDIVIFGMLLLFGIVHFWSDITSFWNVLLYTLIVAMTWNTIDLL